MDIVFGGRFLSCQDTRHAYLLSLCFKCGVVSKDTTLPGTSIGLGVGLQGRAGLCVCNNVWTSCCQVHGKQYSNGDIPSRSLCLVFTARWSSVLPHQCLTETLVIMCERHIALWPATDLCSSLNMWMWPGRGTVAILNFLMKFWLMLMDNIYVVALLKSELG